MKITKILLALAMLGLSLGVQAESETEIDVDEFTLADFDGNGCVDWEELRNRGMLFFHALDTDDNGVIAVEEHVFAKNARGEVVQPGAVDATAFQVHLKDAMDHADRNNNGCLDRKEWD